MTKEEFIETHCKMCGTQRCEGIDSEWFEGCRKRFEYDEYKNPCQFVLSHPTAGDLCNLYSKIPLPSGKSWAHYPECCEENCPLINTGLLTGD